MGGQGWDRGAGAGPESVHIGFQGVEGVHEVGSGITVGRKIKHSHKHLCSPGRSTLRHWTALQVGCGGQPGRVRQNCWAQPWCDPRALALCPVEAGTTPGPAYPLPEPLPGLGWVILTAGAGREPVGWAHCSARSELQAGSA